MIDGQQYVNHLKKNSSTPSFQLICTLRYCYHALQGAVMQKQEMDNGRMALASTLTCPTLASEWGKIPTTPLHIPHLFWPCVHTLTRTPIFTSFRCIDCVTCFQCHRFLLNCSIVQTNHSYELFQCDYSHVNFRFLGMNSFFGGN